MRRMKWVNGNVRQLTLFNSLDDSWVCVWDAKECLPQQSSIFVSGAEAADGSIDCISPFNRATHLSDRLGSIRLATHYEFTPP